MFVLCLIVLIVKGLLSTKIFALSLEQNESRICANVYFATLPLDRFTNKIANTLKTLFAVVFDIEKVGELKPGFEISNL